ncbi:MAG: WD40 repeat domain-containing serine/threonine protein kinase [Planctomycetota bacterium]
MTDSEHNETFGGIPREIGGYRIQRKLGTGGMATVYAALQKQPKRIVALKVMRADISADIARRRFKREIEILGKLSHPNIAHVFDAGTFESDEGERPYFVMEFIDGAQDLLSYIARDLPPTDKRLRMFVKVCAAIEHGHKQRVIHRDLKPSNILIGRNGQPKVIDFGVARAIEAEASRETMTEMGHLVGTVQYMAPEQVGGQPADLDARCDVYALGAVLYKLLTGKAIYNIENVPLLTAAHMIRHDVIPPPSTHKPELRGDLDRIIMKALEKDRRNRYDNAGSLGRDILRYIERKPIQARKASSFYRAALFAKRHRTPITATLIGCFVMGTAIGIVMWDRYGGNDADETSTSSDTTAPTVAALPTPVDLTDAPTETEALDDPSDPFILEDGPEAPTNLRYAAAHDMMIATGPDGALTVWNIGARDVRFRTDDHDGAISNISVAIDGSRIATHGEDGQVVIVDASDGTISSRLEPPIDSIDTIALSPVRNDGGVPVLAVAGPDLTVRCWPSRDGNDWMTLRSSRGAVRTLDWSPDGTSLAAGTERGNVLIWPADGSRPAQLDVRDAPVISVQFTADGDRLFAIDETGHGHVFVRDGDSFIEDSTFSLGRDAPVSVRFDEGRRFIIVNRAQSTQIFDTETMRTVHRGIAFADATALDISPHAGWIARAFADGHVEVDEIR